VLRRVVLSSAALLSGLLLAPAAGAADSWQVPEDARVTVVGHGFGHGHGMSQYGAEGAARQGLTHEEILAFYYPGTSLARLKGKVRVLLVGDTTPDVVVLDSPSLRVRDREADAWVELPAKRAARWRLTPDGSAGTVLAGYRDGRWRPVATMDGEAQFNGGGEPLRLVTPGGTTAYRGALRSVVPQKEASDGPTDRDTVNVLSMHSYLRGVVPLEMPASWSPEAVQAQAVAARTYAAWSRAFPRRTHYDICDTTSCQVYGGVAAEHPDSDAAVKATDKQVLLADDAPAFTQFSASSGGWTAAGSVPYLVAKKDPYDAWPGNPVHDWKVVLTDRDLERRFPRLGDLRRIKVVTRDGAGQWGGRVGTLRLVGSKATVTVSGDTARWTLGLRSTYFSFKVRAASAARSTLSTLRQVSPATSWFDQPRAISSAINPG